MKTKTFLSKIRFILLLMLLAFPVACTPLTDQDLTHEKHYGYFKFSSDIRLSPDEQRADKKLESMREQLLNRYRHDWLFFHSFVDWKDKIVQEDLYKIFRIMPKGGMLHIHATAPGDANWIIDRALSMPDSYIYWGESSDNYVVGQLGVFPDGQIPSGWFKISEFKTSHPNLARDLHQLFTFGPEDQSCPDIWNEFEAIFQRIDAFTSYRPVFVDYYRSAFETLAADGVQFVELRTSLDPVLKEDGSYIKDEELLNLYKTIVNQVISIYPTFELSIITCAWRGATIEEVGAQIERTRALKAKFPDLIVGFDLVGEEDGSQSNGFFSSVLATSPVPLFLHGGESLSPDNHNIQDAYDLKATRISHGINLNLFPDLERSMIADTTLLEICPISNLALRYIDDFRLHPAVDYLKHGVQCTLGSDDPSIFQSRGLSDDVFTAFVSWDLDLASLKKLVINSITYSGKSADKKQIHLDLFNHQWDEFIKEVNRRQ